MLDTRLRPDVTVNRRRPFFPVFPFEQEARDCSQVTTEPVTRLRPDRLRQEILDFSLCLSLVTTSTQSAL